MVGIAGVIRGMSQVDPEAVEERVQSEIDRLDDLETPTPEDLEEFRQALPVQPPVARAVERALPFPYSEVFEFVEGSERQSPYWRTKPDRYVPHSPADRDVRERFAQAARETRGVDGVQRYEDDVVPRSAAHVAESVKGESAEEKRLPATAYRAADKLKAFLKAAREVSGE